MSTIARGVAHAVKRRAGQLRNLPCEGDGAGGVAAIAIRSDRVGILLSHGCPADDHLAPILQPRIAYSLHDRLHAGHSWDNQLCVWENQLEQATLSTYFGDSDLVLVLQAGEYEDGTEDNSGWAEGDWDGDLDFTAADLVFVNQFGEYEPDQATA